MGEGLNPICGCHMSMVPYITPTAIRQRDITHKRSILLPNEEIPCGLIILHLTIITSSCHHEERFMICFMCHKWFHYILVYNIIFSFNQIGYTPSTQRRRRKRNLETCAPCALSNRMFPTSVWMFDFVVASLPSYRSALSGGQTEQAESMPAPPRPCFIVFVQMHGKKFHRSLDFKGTPNEVALVIDGLHSLPVPTCC